MTAGVALPHESARLHVRGAARYADDLPGVQGMLHAAIGTSAVAHGRVTALDLSAVQSAPGVVAVLTADDVDGANNVGPVVHDEPIFARERITCAGQSLFAVIADSTENARRAARLARVSYDALPAHLDALSAQSAGSVIEPAVVVRRGVPEDRIARSTHKLSGRIVIGGQDHFYLEGQIAIATPTDDGGMQIVSSTQNPTETQRLVAAALGVASNKVVVTCRRMGGGFGGKETQSILFACVAALGAAKTGRTVKLRVRRDQDMAITGKRHDFVVDYVVGFDGSGLIEGLQLTLLSRCGHSADLSSAVNTRALMHCDNCYFFDHLLLTSHRCRTNTVSNTAFRGFGAPQAVLAVENVMDEVARHLGVDPLTIRRRHFYGERPRDVTHYGMRIEDNVIARLVGELVQSSRYVERRAEVSAFNATHKTLKRGIALVPVKFGISFTQTALNQAGALVHVYDDGSVMLNHGGTEMGQGLHTKVAQVVARELGIDVARVRVTAADTSKVPNTSPTAASASSDLNGKAAQAAARAVKDRLVEYASSKYGVAPESIEFAEGSVAIGSERIGFHEIAADAQRARISLSATGFYRTPKLDFDAATFSGRPFYYFVYGASVCEVVLDTLTGEHRLVGVDILQDAGRPINSALDLGQIEGAFLQGVGWLTTEELVWSADGRLQTTGPSSYKIPTSYDWPERFNVKIADWGENHEDTIFRSKGIGEPPLMLATAAFLAIKDAIASVPRSGAGRGLNAPATPEAVLEALHAMRSAP
jgi:xanthine dehydrogenase large subunit